MPRIFLCYAPEDEAPVREIHSLLRQEGFQPWMDKLNLSPGENRRREIRRALGVSDFMLIFFSSISVASKGYLQEDFQYALTCLETISEGKIDIIPVRIDSCDPPSSVQHLSLQHLFGADLFEAGGFEKLVATIRERMAMRPNPELERRARRQVQRLLWLGLIFLAALELTLAALTWHYGWDTMEPWTYFFGVFLLVCTYGYFVITTHEFSPRIVYEQLVAARLTRLAQSQSESKPLQYREPVPKQLVLDSKSATHMTEPPHPTSASSISVVTETASAPSFINTIGMEFVLIPAGSFTMGTHREQLDAIGGDDKNCRNRIEHETPQHKVEISRPFYLGKYPVTQAQWQAVMVTNPSEIIGMRRPVENVSWEDAQAFMQKLNEQEGVSDYRLPTEAEWEYACRASSSGLYSFGDDEARLGNYAWYGGSADGQPQPVGQKDPNGWGLYDMHGNIWEWVQDWYGPYAADSVTNPFGPDAGAYRVIRGGVWSSPAQHVRAAFRGWRGPGGHRGVSFRCAMSAPSK